MRYWCTYKNVQDLINQKLLIISPHPDDEVIGCGGLIKKIKENKGKVYVLYLTVGDTRDFTSSGLSTSSERKEEIENVAKFFKFDAYDIAKPGNDYHLKLDTLGQKALMDIIERDSPISIQNTKPTIVAFPFKNSYNQDHRIAALATHAALRPQSPKHKHFVNTVLAYESPAEMWTMHEQTINFYIPLTKAEINAKVKAMELYTSQIRQAPNPRSSEVLKSLAQTRGAQCGSDYAEGYTLYRGIL